MERAANGAAEHNARQRQTGPAAATHRHNNAIAVAITKKPPEDPINIQWWTSMCHASPVLSDCGCYQQSELAEGRAAASRPATIDHTMALSICEASENAQLTQKPDY